jgi:uncharacterized protein
MPHGKFIWNELMTHDLERTKRFYKDTLGWSFEAMQMPDMNYWIIKMGDERVGGVFEMKGADYAGMPEQWVSYIAVDDVDARVKKAVAAGAKPMRNAFDVPNVGRIAFLREPGGATIAWMTPAM